MSLKSHEISHRLLQHVQEKDLDGIAACFTSDGRWQNVPSEPAVGREAILALLRPIFERSERVRWDLVTASYDDSHAWLERVDRFWIDGVEYVVACNGVLVLDPDSGLISELRDYVDLAEWRERLREVDWNST